MKKKKGRKKNFLVVFLVIVMIFVIGFLFGTQIGVIKKTIVGEKVNEKIIVMDVPAVDNKGEGVIIKLETEVRDGTGLVLVNINDVLADYEVQYSARTAVKAAGNYLKRDLGNLDVTYNIKTNASIIAGGSAGAAMAVSAVAALGNKTLNENVMITGTIDGNGSIGEIGAVTEKANAAKTKASKFLVPIGQAYQMAYKKEMSCKKDNGIEYCRIRYIPEKVNLIEGVEIIEVKNLEEALGYFLQ